MKAKLVVENLGNFIPIYNIEVGQEYYAVDSQFTDSYPPEKVKIISIEKDISDMFDVDIMMSDGTIDSWYLEPTDKVFTDINEALRDVLKPVSQEYIKNFDIDVKNLMKAIKRSVEGDYDLPLPDHEEQLLKDFAKDYENRKEYWDKHMKIIGVSFR